MHDLSGACPKCQQILNLYPGFDPSLQSWFEALQKTNPMLHLSQAGRGKIDQEALFSRGASKAHYGESAHNWNAAIDLFFLIDGAYNLNPLLFGQIILPALNASFCWYGRVGAPYYERPHVELTDWNSRAQNGLLHLVE